MSKFAVINKTFTASHKIRLFHIEMQTPEFLMFLNMFLARTFTKPATITDMNTLVSGKKLVANPRDREHREVEKCGGTRDL